MVQQCVLGGVISDLHPAMRKKNCVRQGGAVCVEGKGLGWLRFDGLSLGHLISNTAFFRADFKTMELVAMITYLCGGYIEKRIRGGRRNY